MTNAAAAYGELVGRLLQQAFSQQPEALEAASQVIAGRLGEGGLLYTFGTGHAHLLSLEVFYRAGGLAQVYPLLDQRLMLHLSASNSTDWERKQGLAAEILSASPAGARDVLMIFSNSGRNALPVEMALAGKERGVPVIALTNLQHSKACTPRNSQDLMLYQVADIVLDNCGAIGDAALATGDGRRIGPTSTVIGAALLEAIICRAEQLARAAGSPLPLFSSSNVEGGDAINRQVLAAFQQRIPFL